MLFVDAYILKPLVIAFAVVIFVSSCEGPAFCWLNPMTQVGHVLQFAFGTWTRVSHMYSAHAHAHTLYVFASNQT